jgi:hypothetical protein
LLSAGADSRLILATMTEVQRKNMRFYTSNLSFLDLKEDRDVLGAAMLAERFGLLHQIEKISFYENQFSSRYFDDERILREKQVYGGWHGGEFMGGYFLNAAPARPDLKFADTDEKLKNVFSWRFRWKLKQHPYKTYKQEKAKYAKPIANTMFMINQLTRSFFTGIYGGTRGHWVQPYQLLNHGFSPYWDSRFLQQLIRVPLPVLENYNLYNAVFKYCDKAFTGIPSNSPLTNRSDSVVPKMEIGIEPKNKIPNTHHLFYQTQRVDENLWRKHFYNKPKLNRILEDEFAPVSRLWLDFEAWYALYMP